MRHLRPLFAILLLAAPLACAGASGPRAKDATFAPPRDSSEAQARLDFLETRLDAGRRHAQIWYWSWLAINSGGLIAGTYSAAETDDGGERAFNAVQASQAAIGLADMLWWRPMPGRAGADPLRAAASRGESVDARVAEGERLLVKAAERSEMRRSWEVHVGNLVLQTIGAGILLALDEPGYAGASMLIGLVGGEINLWSEPWRAPGDLADYRQLVSGGMLPSEPPTTWMLTPTTNGLAIQLRY